MIVLGSIVTIFLICLALILLSLKFYILQAVSSERFLLAEAQHQYETPEFLSLLSSLKKHNANLSRIDAFYKKQVLVSGVLKDILLLPRPEVVTFNSIVLEQAKNNIKVKINGQSELRDELVSFKSIIETQPNIKNVSIPPEHLVQPSNVSFALSFDVETKK